MEQKCVAPWRLKWLKNTTAHICYGCSKPLRAGRDVPAPFDVVVCGSEYRTYKDALGSIQMTLKKSDTHYHVRAKCIAFKHENFSGK